MRIATSAFNDSGSSGQSRALRFGPVAAELVERYASLAPDPIKDESVLRIVSWLADASRGKTIKTANTEISSRRFRDELGALKYSGAGSLLNPWKVRRAGVIA